MFMCAARLAHRLAAVGGVVIYLSSVRDIELYAVATGTRIRTYTFDLVYFHICYKQEITFQLRTPINKYFELNFFHFRHIEICASYKSLFVDLLLIKKFLNYKILIEYM